MPRRAQAVHASPARRVLALSAAVLLVAALWLPWWRMECRAPQYGQRVLVVDVSPTAVRGDIKELDELGHYVGMMPLDRFAPVERRLSPYAVALVALVAVSAAVRDARGASASRSCWSRAARLPRRSLGLAALRRDPPRQDGGAQHDREPREARVFGSYAVAQFKVEAYFQAGFWLVLVAAANVIGFLVAERLPRAMRVRGAALAAGLLVLLAPGWRPRRGSRWTALATQRSALRSPRPPMATRSWFTPASTASTS